MMFSLVVELLLTTAAGFWIGGKQPTWRPLLGWSIGLGLTAWLVRCALIVMFPADVAVSEDYLNSMTVWNASVEVAVFCFWVLAWSMIGMAAARVVAKTANGR